MLFLDRNGPIFNLCYNQTMVGITSNVALKEWAAVVEALSRGKQCLLLRKGGIADPDETFQVEHREFFLFPTFEHQKREQVRAEFYPLFDEVLKSTPKDGNVSLPLYAGVAGSWRVNSPKDLEGLQKLHIWTPEFFQMRLSYKPEIPTLVVLVRAFRLPKPPTIPNLPEYAGCKSWVPLKQSLPVENAQPVMPNTDFRKTLELLAARF